MSWAVPLATAFGVTTVYFILNSTYDSYSSNSFSKKLLKDIIDITNSSKDSISRMMNSLEEIKSNRYPNSSDLYVGIIFEHERLSKRVEDVNSSSKRLEQEVNQMRSDIRHLKVMLEAFLKANK